jgi:MFS family permease
MLVGPMTDRIGRKPILIWNGLLVFLSCACRTVVVFFDLNLYLFVIAVMVNGFSETFYTFSFTNYALMPDVTTIIFNSRVWCFVGSWNNLFTNNYRIYDWTYIFYISVFNDNRSTSRLRDFSMYNSQRPMEASGTENEVVDWVIDSTNSFSFQ